jgi:phosphonate transport system ATP-binding protein
MLLAEINKEKGLTSIIVLHHIDFVRDFFNRVIGIKGGEVVFDDNPNKLDERTLDFIYSGHSEEVLAWTTA